MSSADALLSGKTVERVETPTPSPYDGRADESRIVLHLTDGSAVELIGSGDDCDDWIEARALSHSEQLERAHIAADHEREQEEAAIKRREWMALSCEERQAERARRDAERKPGDLLVEGAMFSMLEDFYRPSWSWHDQPERTVRDRCPKCRERECPNAPTRVIPAQPGIVGAAIKAQMGSARARRS